MSKVKFEVLISEGSEDETWLEACCFEGGVFLMLSCGDRGPSSHGRVFTWKQIAQLLIAAEPGMFGVLDEPHHNLFPKTLESLGYCVPN